MTRNNLVVLSLPFQRLIRSHLSPMVLEILTKRADVIIVSPFAKHSDFVNQYKGDRIGHALAPTLERLPWLFRKLVTVSSILRLRGYWCRNRKRLRYYWAIRHISFGENGNDAIASLPKRAVMDILAWIGSWPRAWVLLDSLIGRWSYHMLELTALARPYDHVTLIQAASWGGQDQALAWMGRKHQWKTVLLPYTTDQLWMNGYLYSDFDAVCVQGPMERRFAQDLHEVPTAKVINLGSSYMKALEELMPVVNDKTLSPQSNKQRVMYAGVSPTYFPAECEIQAVNMLSDLDVCNGEQAPDIVYRPVLLSQDIVDKYRHQLTAHERVELQIPSPSSLGLASYSPTNSILDLRRLLDDLKSIDVLIASSVTSLSLEAALLGVPTIAYFPIGNAVFKKRRCDLILDSESRVINFKCVLVATSLEQLTDLLFKLLNNSDMRSDIAETTRREWDYPESNYSLLLERAVFGNN